MRTNFKKLIFLSAFLLVSGIALGQAPEPPGGEPGAGGNQPAGGGAPIAGGIGILLALAAGYGAIKTYNARKAFRKKL